MQRRINALLLAAALVLTLSSAAYAAQDEDPVGTAAMLDIGMSARAMGMGGAHIAVADDAAVIYYNPAGLALIDGHSVTSLYTSLHGAAGYLAVGYAQKNMGGGFIRLNASGIEETDEPANVIGTFGSSDFTAMAGYGREVAPGLSVGGTVKLYSQSLACISGKGVTGDVGALYVMDDGKLSFGAVARNLIGKARYDNNAEDAFERAFGVGAAYRPSNSLLFAADAAFEDGLAARVGAEYPYQAVCLDGRWSAGQGRSINYNRRRVCHGKLRNRLRVPDPQGVARFTQDFTERQILKESTNLKRARLIRWPSCIPTGRPFPSIYPSF